MGTKVRDTLTILNNDGWHLIWQKGYHRQYKHPFKAGSIMVAGELNDNIDPETLGNILKQANINYPDVFKKRRHLFVYGRKRAFRMD